MSPLQTFVTNGILKFFIGQIFKPVVVNKYCVNISQYRFVSCNCLKLIEMFYWPVNVSRCTCAKTVKFVTNYLLQINNMVLYYWYGCKADIF